MARTELTQQNVNRTGVAVTETTGDAVDGHYIVNDVVLREFLYVRNSGASTHTVTIQTPVTVDGLAVDDLAITVGAGVTKLIGPFPADWYNDVDGHVNVDVDNAELMVAALSLAAS